MSKSILPPLQNETDLQAKCYIWFHNTYPQLRGLLCYNLNNSRNKIDGNKNKALGLQPGRSDQVFYYNSTAHMIEFKTITGTQSQQQRQWEMLITSHGFTYTIIRDIDQFKEFITQIVQENPTFANDRKKR